MTTEQARRISALVSALHPSDDQTGIAVWRDYRGPWLACATTTSSDGDIHYRVGRLGSGASPDDAIASLLATLEDDAKRRRDAIAEAL